MKKSSLIYWVVYTWWTVHGNESASATKNGRILDDDRSGRMTVVLNVRTDHNRVHISDAVMLLVLLLVLLLNLDMSSSGGRLSGCFLPWWLHRSILKSFCLANKFRPMFSVAVVQPKKKRKVNLCSLIFDPQDTQQSWYINIFFIWKIPSEKSLGPKFVYYVSKL